jgi:hypothetical protein
MNQQQIMNIITPIIAAVATWLASKVPLLDQATWNTVIGSVAIAVVTVVLGYINRGTAIISQAAALPEVKSVKLEPTAAQSTVDATPDNVTK